MPNYDYVAYIDEAGDDGLKAVKPLRNPGSSEWLILSAVVVRAQNQRKIPEWVANIRRKFSRHHQRQGIHFSNLSAHNKAIACSKISEMELRCFVVASNKKNMQGYINSDAEKIPSQCWFYCWMTRILLERVSHFILHKSIRDHGEARYVRLEYSARGGLRYSQMQAYYEWMRTSNKNLFLPWGRVQFEVLHPNLFFVYPHNQREGLQLADVVASAFFKACDKHDTGGCDTRFARLLHNRMAREPDNLAGQISGYGVKLLPSLKRACLDPDQQEIFEFFGYPNQWWDPEAFSK